MIRAFLSLLISARRNGARNEVGVVPFLSISLSVQETPCRAWRLFVMRVGLSGRRTRCLSACSTAGTTTARSHRTSSAPGLKPAPAPTPRRYTRCFRVVRVECAIVERCLCVYSCLFYPFNPSLRVLTVGGGESLFSKQGYKKRTLTTFWHEQVTLITQPGGAIWVISKRRKKIPPQPTPIKCFKILRLVIGPLSSFIPTQNDRLYVTCSNRIINILACISSVQLGCCLSSCLTYHLKNAA